MVMMPTNTKNNIHAFLFSSYSFESLEKSSLVWSFKIGDDRSLSVLIFVDYPIEPNLKDKLKDDIKKLGVDNLVSEVKELLGILVSKVESEGKPINYLLVYEINGEIENIFTPYSFGQVTKDEFLLIDIDNVGLEGFGLCDRSAFVIPFLEEDVALLGQLYLSVKGFSPNVRRYIFEGLIMKKAIEWQLERLTLRVEELEGKSLGEKKPVVDSITKQDDSTDPYEAEAGYEEAGRAKFDWKTLFSKKKLVWGGVLCLCALFLFGWYYLFKEVRTVAPREPETPPVQTEVSEDKPENPAAALVAEGDGGMGASGGPGGGGQAAVVTEVLPVEGGAPIGGGQEAEEKKIEPGREAQQQGSPTPLGRISLKKFKEELEKNIKINSKKFPVVASLRNKYLKMEYDIYLIALSAQAEFYVLGGGERSVSSCSPDKHNDWVAEKQPFSVTLKCSFDTDRLSPDDTSLKKIRSYLIITGAFPRPTEIEGGVERHKDYSYWLLNTKRPFNDSVRGSIGNDDEIQEYIDEIASHVVSGLAFEEQLAKLAHFLKLMANDKS